MRGLSINLLVVCVACAPAVPKTPAEPAPRTDVEVDAEPRPWIPSASPVGASFAACAVDAPPLIASLATALDRPFSMGSLDGAPQAAALDRGFVLPLLPILRERPHAVACVERQILSASPTVSGWLTAQAGAAKRRQGGSTNSSRALLAGFASASEALCVSANGECGLSTGHLDDDLLAVLTPIVWAARNVVEARRARDNTARGAAWWHRYGGNGLSAVTNDPRPHPGFDDDRAYLEAERGALYAAAIELARTIETTPWERFAGRDLEFEMSTPVGLILVRGMGDDVYEINEPTLLLVDLGGDDVHYDDVASNLDANNAVSIAVDLGGNDRYLTRESPARSPTGAPRSTAGRQGAAMNGVAMLFDLGRGNDRYETVSNGQGYAHQGVGVLFDDGGADHYVAEATSQGSAQYGLALLMDVGSGDDIYESVLYSQGFAHVAGVGALFDDGGDDQYRCDPDERLINPSPQLAGTNANFCQGVGFGYRHDEPALSMAGGLGLLVDAAGADSYEVGVYGQGVGYWQGVGFHVDRRGEDQYTARWYGQGAGVHYGAGVFVDRGAQDDVHDGAVHAVLGVGHDFGLAVALDAGGNDHYAVASLSGGAASCGSVAVFFDERGVDTYVTESDISLGVAVSTDNCPVRGVQPTTAIMIDGDGNDDYSGERTNDSMDVRQDAGDPRAKAISFDTVSADPISAVSN